MPTVSPDVGEWERHLCRPVTGRKVICSFEVLAGMTRQVERLRRWGAQRPLLIGDGVGTGPLPLESDADVYVVESPSFDSLTEQVRARMHASARLDQRLVDLVERYDPEAEALWWVSPVGLNSPLLGRSVLGGRPPAQAALEDKLIVDLLLDEIGAPRPPSAVVPASYDELLSASRQVMAATGAEHVVWGGDSRDGINGGGDYVRWVRTLDQARDAAGFFAAHCDRVRVAPFHEGVPCSIHGIVLPDGVVTLRPVELATLRSPDSGRFHYAGMGTSWDPPASAVEPMRALARTLGTRLRESRGYRGAFGLDGVLTADGFQVTELNPRFSGGITRLARAAPDAQLDLVQLNALLGRDIGRSADDLERDALAMLDEHRFVDVMGASTGAAATETVEIPVAVDEAGLRPADGADTDRVGTVLCGPSSMGAFVRLVLDDDVVRRGDRCAPLSVLLLEFCDRTWGTGFGPLLIAAEHRG